MPNMIAKLGQEIKGLNFGVPPSAERSSAETPLPLLAVLFLTRLHPLPASVGRLALGQPPAA
jgi:hypothetical protein